MCVPFSSCWSRKERSARWCAVYITSAGEMTRSTHVPSSIFLSDLPPLPRKKRAGGLRGSSAPHQFNWNQAPSQNTQRQLRRDFTGGPRVQTVLPMHGARVPFLVGELRSHVSFGTARKKLEKRCQQRLCRAYVNGCTWVCGACLAHCILIFFLKLLGFGCT